jgi:hypothetical protein
MYKRPKKFYNLLQFAKALRQKQTPYYFISVQGIRVNYTNIPILFDATFSADGYVKVKIQSESIWILDFRYRNAEHLINYVSEKRQALEAVQSGKQKKSFAELIKQSDQRLFSRG